MPRAASASPSPPTRWRSNGPRCARPSATRTRTAGHSTWEPAERARGGLPFRTEAAIAKLTASEGGGRVVDRAMQIHGGMGMTKDLPLERWYREMRIRRVGEGPSEVQRVVIAREILGSSLR